MVRSESSDIGSILANNDTAVNSLLLTTASYVANGGVGLILIAGLVHTNVFTDMIDGSYLQVYRTLGWKVIASVGGIYGGLYAWDRFRWNAHAKEQQFKDQFRYHLAAKMRHMASAHTAHCERQAIKFVLMNCEYI
jgi:hypothetical protein